LEKSIDVIPEGMYCYTRNEDNKVKVCPYWDKIKDQPEQMNGYCHYMESGDFESEGLSLLFDMCKECGINDDWDEDEWI
jgi:hypothetical protein